MRGYDEAYFVLQTTCLLAKPKSALEFLQSAKASWTAEGEDLYKSMKTAFAYRLVAQMNDEGCKASSQVRERTEKVARAFFAEGMEGVERVLASL
jgi:ABC-type branched-subunit amino acid transport system substrate-binding protein